MDKEKFIAAAQSYINTPFHHQGRVPNVGLDCIGLVICAANAADINLEIRDHNHYLRRPVGTELIDSIESHGGIKFGELESAERGDLLIFRFENRPQHVGIYLGFDKLIHSYQPAGKVVEITMNQSWKSRFVCGYKIQEA